MGKVSISGASRSTIPDSINSILNDNTWDTISKASQNGTASNYWSVGDCKEIIINGTIGSLSLSNFITCVYIIGFDHNAAIEGYGITFGTFKTALNNGIDIALVDSRYSHDNAADNEKLFNMNHTNDATSVGGWKSCDLRYDILGSTDSDTQHASSTCAINPITDTLMAALPLDLRTVMKPMFIYTDNVGGDLNNDYESNVTLSVDYLPLLSVYEITGEKWQANSYEQKYQKQYIYYSSGNSRVKYKYNDTTSYAGYMLRSPSITDVDNGWFTCVRSENGDIWGAGSTYHASLSLGLAPIFRV